MGTSHTYRYVSVSVSSPTLTRYTNSEAISFSASSSKSITATGISSIRYIFIQAKWGQQHSICYYSTDGSTFTALISLSYFTLTSVSGNTITIKNGGSNSTSCTVAVNNCIILGY